MTTATCHPQPYLLNRHAGGAMCEGQQNRRAHAGVPPHRWRRCALTGGACAPADNALASAAQ
ncbi:hypothetical protein [Ralstonia sp. 1138]|uniref:hypothetical protein n=1 Tax=Ralstonia sp. 1138 TaxID=3156423 RepID=UPI003392C6C6